MSKKLIFVLILLTAFALFVYSSSSSPTPKNYEVFEKYSNGACSKNTGCMPAGCSSHICSSDPGLITTCEAVSDHPAAAGYSCGCVNQTCVWYK